MVDADDPVAPEGSHSNTRPSDRRYLLRLVIAVLGHPSRSPRSRTPQRDRSSRRSSRRGQLSPPSTDNSSWATDVEWTDVTEGACLSRSFNWETYEPYSPFNADATGFRIVDCRSDHPARVLLSVEEPGTRTWQRFGQTDGATIEEIDAWISGVCSATQELLEYARREADHDPSTVQVATSSTISRSSGTASWLLAPVSLIPRVPRRSQACVPRRAKSDPSKCRVRRSSGSNLRSQMRARQRRRWPGPENEG